MADNISFDDLIPSKQTDKSAPSTGADISFDDLIPKQTEARTSTTPLIEGKGGAAFGVYPKATPDQESASRIGTHIGETAKEALLPTGAGFVGFGTGATVAAPYAAAASGALASTGVGAPFAPIVGGAIMLGGGFGGAMVASGAAKWMQDLMHKTFAPEDFARREAERKEFPNATFATELGVGLLGTSPKTTATVAKEGVSKLARLVSTPAGQRAVSGGLQGGIEAGTELATEGTVTPWKVGAATAAGVAMPGMNVAGRVPFRAGEMVGSKISSMLPGGVKPPTKTTIDPLPPKPDEGATPEEKAVYIQKLEAIKAERDAKAPLVETAIRDKETGAIERMGPQSDAQRKADTIDTHDQGFVDERGNFLTREEAVDRAVNTGQLPKDYVLDLPNEGLHSADLRSYGDERFKLPVEQDVNAPPKEVITEKPTENKDFYRQKLASLEQVKAEVLAEVAWAEQNNDPVYQAKMEENLAGVLTEMRKQQTLLDAADNGRSDVKKAIEDNEYKRVELELEAEKAASVGNEQRVTSINEQIKQLETDHAQLYKDMPPVKFEKTREPTWTELQDFLYGTKTIGQALDRILATKELGSLSERILIKALNESNFIRDAKLEFYDDHLLYQDKDGNWKQDAAGLYTGGDVHIVQMGKDGNLPVLLHEAIHAGTQKLLSEQGSTAAVKLQELYDKYKASHGKEVDPTTGADYYGFTDVHEFTAEAFTNKEFQKLLAGIQVGQQPKGVANNLWAAFKETVRKGLGVPEGARTAFDEAMDQGISLVKQSKDFTPRPDRIPTSVPSKAPGSPDEPSTTPGSSIKSLLEKNKTAPEDRTKTDPRDVKDEKEFYEIATDIYEKHGPTEATKFYEGYREYKKTWLEPIKETEKFIGTYLKDKLSTERIIHNSAADLQEIAGKDVNLEKLTYDIDKGVPLTGKAKEVADKFRSLMDDLGKRALENDVIRGWHENYVARNVVTEGTAPPDAVKELMRDLFGYGGKPADPKSVTKYGEQRKLKTREDLVRHLDGINSWLEKNGADYRFKLKTDNLAEIYKDYALAVEKTIENKKLIDNLVHIKNPEGESLIRPITAEQPLPYGWKVMDNGELAGYAVHQDLVPYLNFVFDAGPGKLMKAFGSISQFVKRFNVIGSFFHAKSLMEAQSSAQIPIWSPLKEGVVLPIAEKIIKGATGKELQLSAISKAVEQFRRGGAGDNVDSWIKTGLSFELPEDVSRNILATVGKFTDSMISKYGPKTRALESSMTTVEKYTLQQFDKYTWDYLHTGLKLVVADAYLDKARMNAAKAGKPFDETAARIEISKFVNNSFGGLNWFDAAVQTQNEFAKRMALAAYSPQGRRVLQVLLFAPDWTLSTIRAFTAALPKGLNPTKWSPIEGVKGMMSPATEADYARLYQFKTALTVLTLINGINLITAGRPIWENKDPTRIEYPDGTSMQAMKHAMEPYHWIADPTKTLSNKLGFVPKAAIISIAGTEYASPNAPKLIDRSASGRAVAVAKGMLPFQVSAAIEAPEGEGAKRALLGTMGLPLYGATAEQNKLRRAEREVATKEQAWEYRDKEIKAGRMPWTSKHDRDKKSLDKQRKELDKKAGKE
jgi:hypothetical protein